MNFQDRLPHQQRQEKRFSRAGLFIEFNRTRYPVINIAEGGLLVGDASIGLNLRQKIFFSLFHEA